MDPSNGQETRPSAVPEAHGGGRFRRTLIRVLAVQAIALLLLWWLQTHYAP
jgi:hypothetical protein